MTLDHVRLDKRITKHKMLTSYNVLVRVTLYIAA